MRAFCAWPCPVRCFATPRSMPLAWPGQAAQPAGRVLRQKGALRAAARCRPASGAQDSMQQAPGLDLAGLRRWASAAQRQPHRVTRQGWVWRGAWCSRAGWRDVSGAVKPQGRWWSPAGAANTWGTGIAHGVPCHLALRWERPSRAARQSTSRARQARRQPGRPWRNETRRHTRYRSGWGMNRWSCQTLTGSGKGGLGECWLQRCRKSRYAGLAVSSTCG